MIFRCCNRPRTRASSRDRLDNLIVVCPLRVQRFYRNHFRELTVSDDLSQVYLPKGTFRQPFSEIEIVSFPCNHLNKMASNHQLNERLVLYISFSTVQTNILSQLNNIFRFLTGFWLHSSSY